MDCTVGDFLCPLLQLAISRFLVRGLSASEVRGYMQFVLSWRVGR